MRRQIVQHDVDVEGVLTFNKGFEEWGETFGDEVMPEALIDRPIHHCHLVTIRGNSYRIGSIPSSGRPCTPRTTTWRWLAARAPSGVRDDLRLVPSSICQIFDRRISQILPRR